MLLIDWNVVFQLKGLYIDQLLRASHKIDVIFIAGIDLFDHSKTCQIGNHLSRTSFKAVSARYKINRTALFVVIFRQRTHLLFAGKEQTYQSTYYSHF
ncbi:hypothetical protein D3C81_1708120 [compost metagenome]